jgi:hypothetical protein
VGFVVADAHRIRKGRSKQYYYYRCSEAKNGFNCPGKRIRADKIDAFLVDTILERVLTKRNVTKIVEEIRISTSDWFKDRMRRREAAVAELRTAESRRNKIFDLFETVGTELPEIRSMSGRLGDLNNQILARKNFGRTRRRIRPNFNYHRSRYRRSNICLTQSRYGRIECRHSPNLL